MVDRINQAGIGPNRKLDNTAGKPVSGQEADKTAGGSDTTAAKAAQANTVDTGLVNRTQANIEASDGIDRGKVEAIKTAIRNGEFAIDAQAVAKAFVELEAEF